MNGIRVPPGITFPTPTGSATWVVGGLIRDPDGRLFVQRRLDTQNLLPGAWDLVGGHVMPGEGILEALAREIAEETGWRLRAVVADLGVIGWTGDDGVDRREADYVVEVDGDLGEPRLEAGVHEDPRWITRTDIAELLNADNPGDRLAYLILERAFAALE